ncbi:Polyadenylate-binding protein 2 [Glycine soja]|nr:Polyadenylate-binding protein 2 [Glycine soja]
MEQEEHEVYGADIPDEEIDMDADAEQQDEQLAPNHTNKELEDMKKRLKEIEEEASALREMQAKVEKEMGAVQDSSGTSATQVEKEEVDARSIYVGTLVSLSYLLRGVLNGFITHLSFLSPSSPHYKLTVPNRANMHGESFSGKLE